MLPEKDFRELMTAQMGQDETRALLEALDSAPQTSIRVNSAKSLLDRCAGAAFDGVVPWASDAWYLEHRPDFTSDPLLHSGCYYVQDASSMFIEQAVRHVVKGPVRMLDLCAAPGGKSTHLAQLLPSGSVLVSNDIQRSRANVLCENMTKWGRSSTMVTCNTPLQIGQSGLMFNFMLIDAPCSGEGMFRKDETAVADWSIEAVDMCSARQKQIIEDVWPALLPGGWCIYSTCTFNNTEDEGVVRWMTEHLGAIPVAFDVPAEWGIAGSMLDGFDAPVYHFFPHRVRGEGFFMALLQKPSKGDPTRQSTPRLVPSADAGPCAEWLRGNEFYFYKDQEGIWAAPQADAPFMWQVSQTLYCLKKGVRVGTLKGRDIQPAHSLAMSLDMELNAFRHIPLTLAQSQDYLRCEALHLQDAPKGVVLVTYNDIPLGLVKNLGSRANNLYPQQWRIRRQNH